MGPDAGGIKGFFFDRNLGHRVPDHFADRGCAVAKHDDHFFPDTKDPELLAAVAEAGWIFITQDTRIRRRPAERQALVDAGIQAFALVSTANLSAAETIDVLERAEDEIKRTAAEKEGPFLYGIRKDGRLGGIALT